MKNYWLLKCNSEDVWDLDRFVWEGHGSPESWSLAQRVREVHHQDRAALWVTGPKGGLVAVGTIVEFPYLGTGDDHWFDPAEQQRVRWYVDVEWEHARLDAPIPPQQVLGTGRFDDAEFVRIPRGGNPSRLTGKEWRALRSLI